MRDSADHDSGLEDSIYISRLQRYRRCEIIALAVGAPQDHVPGRCERHIVGTLGSLLRAGVNPSLGPAGKRPVFHAPSQAPEDLTKVERQAVRLRDLASPTVCVLFKPPQVIARAHGVPVTRHTLRTQSASVASAKLELCIFPRSTKTTPSIRQASRSVAARGTAHGCSTSGSHP